MRIRQLRLKGFQSFGPEPTTVDLEELTYILGPNGSGKTAVLEALSRLFSPLAAQRRIRVEDSTFRSTEALAKFMPSSRCSGSKLT
jgi:putative ATP-dependent endonuclease of OLD family